MKNILKFILSTLIGALIGGALVGGIIFILEGREGMADMMNKVSELPMIDFLVPILLAFAAMFTAIVLHIVLHEGGHLLMGFATGYRFTSFRIASIAFIRREGRTRVRRYKLAGTGGQSLFASRVCDRASGYSFHRFAFHPAAREYRSSRQETVQR